MKTLTNSGGHATQTRHSACCDERIKCLVDELAAQCGMVHLPESDVTCICGTFCVVTCFLAPSCDALPCRIVLVRMARDPSGAMTEVLRWHVSDNRELMELFMA